MMLVLQYVKAETLHFDKWQRLDMSERVPAVLSVNRQYAHQNVDNVTGGRGVAVTR